MKQKNIREKKESAGGRRQEEIVHIAAKAQTCNNEFGKKYFHSRAQK